MKKVFWVMVVCMILVLVAGTQGIADDGVAPCYEDTASVTATLSITGGVANCGGSVKPGSSTSSATVSVRLQRKDAGSWTTMATWTGNSSSGYKASASGSTAAASGYSYRVYVTGVVRNANGVVIERPNKTSREIAY